LEDYVSSREDGEDAEHGNSSEDVGTYDDDDDVDEDFLVDEENEIVEPDVDDHLFSISMDLPFDNIGVTNLVLDDVLEGEEVDVINVDGFDSDPGNDVETNYRKRRLAELRTEMEGVINASGTGLTGLNHGMEAEPSRSSGPTTRSKKRKNTGINDDSQASPSFLDAHDKGDLCPWVLAKAKAEREIRGDHVLRYSMLRDYVVELHSINPNTTVKIVVERNTNPSLPTMVFQRIYICLGALKLGFRACKRDLLCLDGVFMKGSFLGQVLVAIGLDSNNGIYPLAYALVEAESRAKSDLLLNNICEVFNGKIVGGKDKPVITLLEYIREYCMKKIMNVQGVIDKCTGLLTPTATRIIESIKKEAHLMKVQWNGANKYQVSCLLEDHCVVNVVGRPRKKRKRSKHDDEAFVKDGKLRRKGRTITCQSCKNTGHNKKTCRGQGRKATTGGNNAEVSGSVSRQAQETEPAVGQDGSGGLGADVVIGLSTTTGEGGASGPGGAGVSSQGSSHSRCIKRRVQIEKISPQKRTLTQPASQPSTSSQVPVSEIRNADGREMGDGVPTQSSATRGASEWSFL
ncbi:hypothetical protein Tco_0344264, partial [Tanacetum coccineum]